MIKGLLLNTCRPVNLSVKRLKTLKINFEPKKKKKIIWIYSENYLLKIFVWNLYLFRVVFNRICLAFHSPLTIYKKLGESKNWVYLT